MTLDETYRGIDISYASICERRAWLSLHEIYITDGTEFVKLGRYSNDEQRKYGYSQVAIGRNKIDYIQMLQSGEYIIHEFKRGRKVIDADIFQVSHYMNIADQSGYNIKCGEIHLLGSKKDCISSISTGKYGPSKEKVSFVGKTKENQHSSS